MFRAYQFTTRLLRLFVFCRAVSLPIMHADMKREVNIPCEHRQLTRSTTGGVGGMDSLFPRRFWRDLAHAR